MIFFTDEELDRLIAEDVPYFDMTTKLAKFGSQLARIQFFTKEPTVICCTEEILRLFAKFNISPTLVTLSGEYIEGNVKFLEAEGLAKHLHSLWRVASNLMEFASGIATSTMLMVEEARKFNPHIIVATTRKTIPYTRKIAAKAVIVGGGNINRLSLSDSIVLTRNHYKFFGGLKGLVNRIEKLKDDSAGRPITVVVNNETDALMLGALPVDIIQLEDMAPKQITKLVEDIRTNNPTVRIAAAGGITTENVVSYADTGIDIIITSFPNHCKPAEFRVEIDSLIE